MTTHGALAQDNGQMTLPVTRVVLYTNGVGYFEHSGTISGSQEFSLPVETDNMDDLLQSLVLLDHDGGSIRPIRYPAEDPLGRTLSSYALDLSGNPTLANLLLQARGEFVSVSGSQTVEGLIVSVERVTDPEGPDRHLLLLATDSGLQRIALEEVRSLEFASEQLRQDMQAALSAVAQHREDDLKGVRLRFEGEGERFVQVGYVREMPVWKTSYRLVLGDDGTAELQGWAIFDNPTPLDLNDVEVTFVAGQPVSFITQLYEAVYVQRQRIAPPVSQSAAPPLYADSVVTEMMMPAPAPPMSARSMDGFAASGLMDAGVEAMASGVQSGVTFQFVVDSPVSVGRFESAMIPIIQQQVPAQRLSILDPSLGMGNPLRGVQLVNDTGLHLAAGTVTVFDAGTFTGTARIGDVLPGADALMAFATDLAVSTSRRGGSQQEEVISLRIQDGVLISEIRNRISTTYELQADLEENRLVLIEHPRTPGHDLVAPQATDLEVTPDTYRFGVLLAAEAEDGDVSAESAFPVQLECVADRCEIVVVEERLLQRRVALSNMTTDSIVTVLQNGMLDDAGEELLAQLLETGAQLTALQRQLDALARERDAIFQEQTRIRSNMAQLDQSSSLYQRYATQLNDQEDELERIAEERAELEEELRQLQEERDGLLRTN